ncbi:MAG TPA: hypothetical protein VMC61_04775 [Methanocella sp.]|nr:hypothetical protein [Methanocella sp.]
MGDDNKLGLLNQLWKHKLIITLAFAVLALAASTIYYHGQSDDRAAALGQKSTEYDALNATYNDLSVEHAALTVSNENLTERYDNLSGQYNNLVSNTSSMRTAYENLSATVTRFQETDGASLALSYRISRTNTPDGPRVFVNATVYNVGNKKADYIAIKCKIIHENQPDVDEHVITDLGPLDKKSISWNYSSYTDIDALWI